MTEFFVFDHEKVEKIDRCGSSAFFVVEVPRALPYDFFTNFLQNRLGLKKLKEI